jgi:diguanylate cyclase (GGDEF)-like protein
MLDIDLFKMVNDTYGHLVGDVLLITAANTLNRVKRKEDFVFRYGGDEFFILLPNTPLAGAN